MTHLDWTAVAAIGTFLQAIASIFLLAQLFLMRRQMLHTETWNRRNASVELLFKNARFSECERIAAAAMKSHGVNLYLIREPMNSGIVDTIFLGPDSTAYEALKEMLNMFENIAAAVEQGILDHDYVRQTKGDQVSRYFLILKPLIYRCREHCGNYRIWIDMENLVGRWADNPYPGIDKAAVCDYGEYKHIETVADEVPVNL